ncbi:hypothetical protein PVMG_01697 [Plasmodium vivax Mauritania I]|uniref:Transmembrane protein n=1 Tax=Plasmodium vivax Mauritania I TaxID=1035515 RepID=A0A0J9T4K5_PLAVI|nr:hypothetical protein PVMG_01697 [Plasmodium vivax Mauritania I]
MENRSVKSPRRRTKRQSKISTDFSPLPPQKCSKMKKAAFFSTLKYVRIPSPLTVNRNMRRFNMAENDRKIFFSFNLFSVFLFTLPVVYLTKANYQMCEENEMVYNKLCGSRANVTRGLFSS